MDYKNKALQLHKKNRGKLAIKSKIPLKSNSDLSTAYTPGVGEVSLAIARNKNETWLLTNRANSIAVISDGSAVLGLGNIGPEAAMPVMEGKAIIFKQFADIDAFPLCIKAETVDEIINFAKMIEPSFGGINLEDISSPRCFEIQEKLDKELSIPVFHDDQYGTAIVTLAALINSCRLTNSVLKELKIVINGAGAAGIATARLLMYYGVRDIILLDSKGAIYAGRNGLNKYKKIIAARTNRKKIKGSLKDVVRGADAFIGLSKGGVLKREMVSSMNQPNIVLAMANPYPEILPPEAKKAGATIVGTGRSDFPNQVNNALVFPGIFRGLLDKRARKVTNKMMISAAIAIAYSNKNLSKNNILPKVTNKNVIKAIARAVTKK